MPDSQDAVAVATPRARVRRLNDAPIDPGGNHVLYWMTSARRTRWNFALQRAAEHCVSLRLPLLVLEPLRVGYPWACDRFHRFIVDGMVDNRARCRAHDVAYYPYVESRDGVGKGLVAALAASASVVVCDDYPAFFLPRMLEAAAHRIPVRAESVDSNGLLPMRAAARTYATAHAFRRHLHGNLPAHHDHPPIPAPLATIPTRQRCAMPCTSRAAAPPTLSATRPPCPAAPTLPPPASPPSSNTGSPATPPTGTTPNATRPAVCPPTCISATSPSTRSSTASRHTRPGTPPACAPKRRADASTAFYRP